jgi:hypothetical protein
VDHARRGATPAGAIHECCHSFSNNACHWGADFVLFPPLCMVSLFARNRLFVAKSLRLRPTRTQHACNANAQSNATDAMNE